MKKSHFFFILGMVLFAGNSLGQINYNTVDNFDRSDSNSLGLTSSGNTTWTEFEPVSEDDQLTVLSNTLVATTSGVSGNEPTCASISLKTEEITYDLGTTFTGWSFHFDLNRNPSGWGSSSYSLGFVLTANEQDFTSNTVDGYAVVWNGTNDELVLTYFEDGISGTSLGSPIINTGVDWDENSSDGMNIRVEVNAAGKWTLYWEAGVAITTPVEIDANSAFSANTTNLFTDNNTFYSGPIWAHATATTSSSTGSFDNFNFGIGTEPTTTSVQFTSSSVSISEEIGSYDLTLSITNHDLLLPTSCQVSLTGSSGENPNVTDIGNYTTQNVTFPASSSDNQTVSITITDDIIFEGNEDFTFSILNVTGGNSSTIGTPASFTLTIEENEIAALVINEIHADPDAENGDANNDGIINSSDDEFIEIYNNSAISIDLENYTINDAIDTRHTFPAGSSINPYDYIVIFGGETPSGFEIGKTQTASTGSLSLNNAGDQITIKNNLGTIQTTVSYGSIAGDNQSIVRSPAFTGDFVKHSDEDIENKTLFSPLKNTDGTLVYIRTWTGSIDNDWHNTENWTTGIPNAYSEVTIPNTVSNYPTISRSAPCKSITMESDATLLGSHHLIISGSSTIKRSLTINKWQYVTSPITNSTANNVEIETEGENAYLVSYNNDVAGSGTDLQLGWEYIVSDKTNLTAGIGYGVYVDASKEINFRGTLVTGDQNISGVASGDGGVNKWVLIGNSALAHIDWTNVSPDADITSSAYFYDASNDRYATITHAGPSTNATSTLIPPMQGFFVQVDTYDDSNITLPISALTHGNQTFYKSKNIDLKQIRIAITKNDYQDETLIYFSNEATNGYESSFDANKLKVSTPGIPQLYSVIGDHQLAINAMNNTEESIPLQIQSSNNEKLKLNVLEIDNFDSNTQISLIDNENDISYDLIKNKVIELDVSIGENENRFFINISNSTSNNEFIKTIKVFPRNKSIIISSAEIINSKIRIYDISGKLIHQSSFNENLKEINNINTGIYIVEINSKVGVSHHKVSIQ